MTVSGSTSLLCLFQSKVEDAVALVPDMGAEEKLKSVQFWNAVSGKLQEIVNNSAADINALAMKLDENSKKVAFHIECGSTTNVVSENNVYSSDYINGESNYVVCSETSSHYATENLNNTQNEHFIPPSGTSFSTICFPDSNSDSNSMVCVSDSTRINNQAINHYSKAPILANSVDSVNEELKKKTGNTCDILEKKDVELRNGNSSNIVPVSRVRKIRSKKTAVKESSFTCSNLTEVQNSTNGSYLLQLLTTQSLNGDLKGSSGKGIDSELSNAETTCVQLKENGVVHGSKLSSCTAQDEHFDSPDKSSRHGIGKTVMKSGEFGISGDSMHNSSFSCDWCDQEFSDILSLDSHRLMHTKPFFCTECDAQFSCKGNLMVHYRKHTGEKPYNCSMCTARFSTRGNLKRHIRSHSGLRPHQCSHCGSCFTEKKSLVVHMRRHTGEKPYECKLCGRKFSQSGILQSHMAVHLNERSHLCEHCGKAFRQKSQLRIHMLRHEGIRNYNCKQCSSRFLIKGDLERHKRIHTGERPFVCDVCRKSFTRQQSLKEHLNRHYGIKPFQCKHCGKGFAEMSACYKHMKHHAKLNKESNQNAESNEAFTKIVECGSPQISSQENNVNVVEGENITVIFEGSNQEIEVHSEFTVESELASLQTEMTQN